MIEDFLGNREIFGPSPKPTPFEAELEKAYGTEMGETLDNDFLFVKALGKEKNGVALEVEVSDGEKKKENFKVKANDYIVIVPQGFLKLKIRGQNGFLIKDQKEFLFEGDGKKRVIIEASLDQI